MSELVSYMSVKSCAFKELSPNSLRGMSDDAFPLGIITLDSVQLDMVLERIVRIQQEQSVDRADDSDTDDAEADQADGMSLGSDESTSTISFGSSTVNDSRPN